MVFPQLASVKNDSVSVGTATFSDFPAVRSTLNCTPATPERLACAPDLPDWARMKVGAKKYSKQTSVFGGTGTFGRVLPLQRYENLTGYNAIYHPDCPSILIGFGHVTNSTIDKASGFVCSPYAETIRVSVTFRLPRWELVEISSPSTSTSTSTQYSTGSGRGTIREDIKLDSFMQSFASSIFSNPLARLELNATEDLNSIFPLALYGRNSTSVAQLEENLPQALETTFSVAMAHFLNHARQTVNSSSSFLNSNSSSGPEGVQSQSQGQEQGQIITGTVATPNSGKLRLRQSVISTRILQGLLGAMVVCVGMAYLLQRHMGRVLPKGPCSVAAGASLLAGSDLLGQTPPGTEWMSDNERKKSGMFEGKLFGLGIWAVENPFGSSGEDSDRQREEEVRKWFGIDFEWVGDPDTTDS